MTRERLEVALGALTRQSAPRELDGRVVATLHAGYRQDRAVRWLSDLAPLAAPGPLDRSGQASAPRVDSPEPTPFQALTPKSAPPVLERLVAESLQRGSEGRVRAALGRLPRQEAPEALAGLINQALKAPAKPRSQRLRLTRGAWAAAAMLLVTIALTRPLIHNGQKGQNDHGDPRDALQTASSLSFRLISVRDASQLSPEAQQLVLSVATPQPTMSRLRSPSAETGR